MKTSPSLLSFYPVEALAFGRAWSRLAPGWGGWGFTVDDGEAGEVVTVRAPGATVAVFTMTNTREGVEVWWQPADCALTPGEPVGVFQTLRAALLHLCPLSPTSLRLADREAAAAAGKRRKAAKARKPVSPEMKALVDGVVAKWKREHRLGR